MNLSNKKQYQVEDFKYLCIQIENFSKKYFGYRNVINVESENNGKISKEETSSDYTKEIIECIRNIAEMLIWEDQNNEQGFFDLLCEYGIFNTLVDFVVDKEMEYLIRRQSLQTISILLQNIRNIQILYFLLSNNVITKLLNCTFESNNLEFNKNGSIEINFNINIINKEQEEQEELLSYYIALLRTLALRLNKDTIRLFYNEEKGEFPLWRNACYYINHRDVMVKNTSRNVLLNLLRNGDYSIVLNVVYEEIRHYHDSKKKEIFKELNLDNSKIDVLSNFSVNKEYPGLIQIIISSLVKQIHQFCEIVENLNFCWPKIQEYMDKIMFNIENNNLEVFRDSKSSLLSTIKATSPITLSYSETDSTETYNSPMVNPLNTSFYDSLIRPLMDFADKIYDILEFIDELFCLEINIINKLLGISILQQVFEMVIFQNIINRIQVMNETSSNNNPSLRIYLFLIYQILLFFYKNNENAKYDILITSIWNKFVKIGNKNCLFGNIFSTLINYINDDSEFMLLFGLLNLYSNWKNLRLKIKNRFLENSELTKDSVLNSNYNNPEKENQNKFSVSTPNFFQFFINNLNKYLYQKDEYEDLLQELYNENNKDEIKTIKIEFFNSSPNQLQKYRQNIFNSDFKRNKSVPKNWKYKEENESNVESESLRLLINACINYKRLNLNFEDKIEQIEVDLKSKLQIFYSKVNCEIVSQYQVEIGLEYILFLAQFFEKFVYISSKNNYENNIRPLCFLVISFLSIDIIINHELLRQNDCFLNFKSVINCFLKFIKCTTLKVIGNILKMDITNHHVYSFFENISNINYMLCEHLFEWADEDFLLISKLFDNSDKSFIWIHNIISNFCLIPKIQLLNSTVNAERYIWNLIDTYPLLRWFPNTCNDDSQSIFIDRLRSNFNNFQIITNLVERINNFEIKNSNFESLDQCSIKTYNLNKINISSENKLFKVLLIRAKRKKINQASNIHCFVIFDNLNDRLIFTTLNFKSQQVILLAQFEYIRCKPVPIITRSYKTTIRYIVALLVRYKKNEEEKYMILNDIMYELPLREDLLNSPNISKGAIVQPKERKINKKIYYLNNLLLPIYTRVNLDKIELQLDQDLNFNDYALYIEFESKKKSQEFIKKLNSLRQNKFVNKLYEVYNNMYEDIK